MSIAKRQAEIQRKKVFIKVNIRLYAPKSDLGGLTYSIRQLQKRFNTG